MDQVDLDDHNRPLPGAVGIETRPSRSEVQSARAKEDLAGWFCWPGDLSIFILLFFAFNAPNVIALDRRSYP
jgi:hypothetical protein